jgi:hypothetical protein
LGEFFLQPSCTKKIDFYLIVIFDLEGTKNINRYYSMISGYGKKGA